MKFDRHAIQLIVVAVVALAAGRFGFPIDGNSMAADREQTERSARHGVPSVQEPGGDGDIGAPGHHHRHLDQLLGDWKLELSVRSAADAPPDVFRGSIRRDWVLDGRFVKETFEVTSDHGPLRGIGFVGYNKLDGRYEMAWLDSMSTGITFETGMYHPDDKVLHWRGEVHDPVTGRMINSWGKLDMSDPDRHVHTGYSVDPEGRTFKAVEAISRRSDLARP